MKMKIVALALVFASAIALTFAADASGKKKIALIAGTPSHGPGEHEFNAGVALLKKCLDGVPGIVAEAHLNGWPKSATALDDADAILIFSDGGGGHLALQGNHVQKLDELMQRGVGLMCAHYAVEVPKGKGGPEFLRWIGGYYESGFSTNPHWVAEISNLPDHPITRGVKPFAVKDEWYYNMRWPADPKGVTPILVAKPSDETRLGKSSSPQGPYPHIVAAKGQDETLMWAMERPDGGRGVGFTGGHFHQNWGDENFRKVVLNALIWIAKMEVPKTGVASTITKEDLEENLDPKGGAPRPKSLAIKGYKYKSAVVTQGTVSIDVDVTGAKTLALVVTDGGDGITADWSDWAEPQLLKADGSTTKLTDIPWKSATTGWGQVQLNHNVNGGPLKIAGKDIPYGIGTHAASIIIYDIADKGFTRFQTRAGLDNGGTDQGMASSVEFLVFTDKAESELAKMGSTGGRGSGPEAAEDSLKAFTVAEGLEVSVFASEPMMFSPTNMDIDSRGRVWITEVTNYRSWEKLRPEGDRILILEDTDGDGKADKVTTFYQGTDINSALGICVRGDKVIVSCSPNVFVFTNDGHDHAAKKELLFTNIGFKQHDHGAHAFVSGPDGKLYFNNGNAHSKIGYSYDQSNPPIQNAAGEPITDRAGNVVGINGKYRYRQGLVFRCNPDGSDLETLGWNFRNNYEVNVDSFGTMWQSDNDDDGNRGVRINYVMDWGNFGYVDEMTGANWQTKRTNWEKEIPNRHWHQNDPGVVPNLLTTGNGSPTGICIYEGELLPPPFRNQILHCDAGPNVVRAYPVTPDGAGYKAESVNLLKSKDSWFRPADVCVGPDGAVYVADWNDPGVGGHAMGDNILANIRGRIYRIAPPNYKSVIPKLNLDTPAGCVTGLQSPNQATRSLAWNKLHDLQGGAEGELLKLWQNQNPRFQARALQLLARIKGKENIYLDKAIAQENSDLRITALRIARAEKLDVIPLVKKLITDKSPAVRRECALSLHHATSPEAPLLWAKLAQQHDGQDRWYLEALGIGADKNEDACFSAWLNLVGNQWNTPAGRDVIWRTRSKEAPALLAKIIKDPATSEADRPRYFRAFDFLKGSEKDAALADLLLNPPTTGK